jgi:predicted Zn-dependent peptidase
LRNLAENPVPAAELRRARDYVVGQLELNLESTESQMNWVGESFLSYGKIISPTEVKNRLTAVNAASVRAVARECFRPERLNLALVSPQEKHGRLAELLAW